MGMQMQELWSVVYNLVLSMINRFTEKTLNWFSFAIYFFYNSHFLSFTKIFDFTDMYDMYDENTQLDTF